MVFVTQSIDPSALSRLRAAGLRVTVRHGEAPIGRGALLRGASRVLIPMPTDRIDGEVLDAGPVALVASHAVGTDHIDLDACRARGVAVTNTPGVLTDATADLAMALLLACTRGVLQGDALVRAGRFRGWHPLMLRGLELRGARLGIVGLGRIGRATAERARAFGMEVVHSSRSGGLPLDELLATSDVVSLHCPLTEATHHLLDAPALATMKPGAWLVNTARGPVVDEAALAEALQGHLAGAGLDVYEHEPRVHEGLVALPNVVLLPHLGSATHRARRLMAATVVDNVLAWHGGRPLPTPIL